jgi:hypothetical protein
MANRIESLNGYANGDGASHPSPSATQLLPHNEEAEKGVIGACLWDNDKIEDAITLRPEDFYRDCHQHMWAGILELYGQGKPVDGITLGDLLQSQELLVRVGGHDGIAGTSAGCPNPENVREYVGIVREKSHTRQAIQAAAELTQAGYASSDRAKDIIAVALGRLEAVAEPDADDEIAVPDWPSPPAEAAWRGPAGELVRLIEPHTEADPVAILVQFLVGFGNLLGPGIHCKVGPTRHHLNLYAAIVGPSGSGRKGTSLDQARSVLRDLDPEWLTEKEMSGLSSGEGLIWEVRDPAPAKKAGEKDDEGVADKRLLVVESELGRAFRGMLREGNTLSSVLRLAWDGGTLRTMSRNSRSKATGPHVSLIGHITREELLKLLGNDDASNGFANRFLWACARDSKSLPEGGEAVDFSPVRARLGAAVEKVKAEPSWTLIRDPAARALWAENYDRLKLRQPGLLGIVTGRAEAQVLRLSAVYAALDSASIIRREHLESALALWDYCLRSATYIFGGRLSDPVAVLIANELRAAGPAGLSRSRITRILDRKRLKASRGALILQDLLESNRVVMVPTPTTGRTSERWYAAEFRPGT